MVVSRSLGSAASQFLAPIRATVARDVFSTTRAMATTSAAVKVIPAPEPVPQPFAIKKAPTVLLTVHSFPTMEPVRFDQVASTFLHAPLRRDILHRAVIFEGDAHRLGRAKTKYRHEVRGSTRKIRPQKGTGQARLGDKKSPMLRGGGVAHGPKPRDFSTGLQRKVYDLAWRTALSYRYRRGELVVVDGSLDLQEADPGLANTIVQRYGWGKQSGRSLFVTNEPRENLANALEELKDDARVLTKFEIDVKDMLETGRVIIEREALAWLEKEHGLGVN